MTHYDKLENKLKQLVQEAKRQYLALRVDIEYNVKGYTEDQIYLKEREMNIQFGKIVAYSDLAELLREYRGKKNEVITNK